MTQLSIEWCFIFYFNYCNKYWWSGCMFIVSYRQTINDAAIENKSIHSCTIIVSVYFSHSILLECSIFEERKFAKWSEKDENGWEDGKGGGEKVWNTAALMQHWVSLISQIYTQLLNTSIRTLELYRITSFTFILSTIEMFTVSICALNWTNIALKSYYTLFKTISSCWQAFFLFILV